MGVARSCALGCCVLLSGVLVVGCGSSTVNYKTQYSTLLAPVNHAAKALGAEQKAHPKQTPSQDEASASTYLQALTTADHGLSKAHWPAQAQSSVAALITADQHLAAAIRDTSAAGYADGVTTAKGADAAAKAKLRSALGITVSSSAKGPSH